jgi:hypothetical protein
MRRRTTLAIWAAAAATAIACNGDAPTGAPTPAPRNGDPQPATCTDVRAAAYVQTTPKPPPTGRTLLYAEWKCNTVTLDWYFWNPHTKRITSVTGQVFTNSPFQAIGPEGPAGIVVHPGGPGPGTDGRFFHMCAIWQGGQRIDHLYSNDPTAPAVCSTDLARG